MRDPVENVPWFIPSTTAQDIKLIPSCQASAQLLLESIPDVARSIYSARIARSATFDKTTVAVRLTLAPCQTIFPTIFIRHYIEELYRSYAHTTRCSGMVNSGLFGY